MSAPPVANATEALGVAAREDARARPRPFRVTLAAVGVAVVGVVGFGAALLLARPQGNAAPAQSRIVLRPFSVPVAYVTLRRLGGSVPPLVVPVRHRAVPVRVSAPQAATPIPSVAVRPTYTPHPAPRPAPRPATTYYATTLGQAPAPRSTTYYSTTFK